MAYVTTAAPIVPAKPAAGKGIIAQRRPTARAVVNIGARKPALGNSPAYVVHQFPGDGLGDDGIGFALPVVASVGSSIVKGISSLFGGGKPNPRPAIAAAKLQCVQQYGDIDAARYILHQKDYGATADGKAAYQSAWATIVSQYPAIAARAQQLGGLTDTNLQSCVIGPAPTPGSTAAPPAPVTAPVVTPAAPTPALPAPATPMIPLTSNLPGLVDVQNPQLAALAQQLQQRKDAAAAALAQTNAQIQQVQQQITALQQSPAAAASSPGILDKLTAFLDSLSQKAATAAGTVQTIDQGFQQLSAPTIPPDQFAAQLAALNQQTQHADGLFGSGNIGPLLLVAGLAAGAAMLFSSHGSRSR